MTFESQSFVAWVSMFGTMWFWAATLLSEGVIFLIRLNIYSRPELIDWSDSKHFILTVKIERKYKERNLFFVTFLLLLQSKVYSKTCVKRSHITWKFVSFVYVHRTIMYSQNEPVHEISNNEVCATSKASDQPAPSRSLIRAFASRLGILWLLGYWLSTIWSF